jgi:hypothetical protein
MKTIQFIAIMSIFLGFMASCATTQMVELTQEEKAYLEKARKQPLEFTVSEEKSDKIWGRAQSFIAKHSSFKLQNTTDYVIQTYYPTSGDAQFGYKVIKTEMNNGVEITVDCFTGNVFMQKDADTNAHILAYYLKTGELVSDRIIAK